MKSCVLFIAAMLIVTLGACKKPHPNEPVTDYDYVTFGHFYGECMGEQCVEMFRIEDGSLYEDTIDAYPSRQSPTERHYIKLSADKYNLVKDIQSKIPAQIFLESSTVIGKPDQADGGGVYLEVQKNGERRFWLIDNVKDNIPSYLHALTDEIRDNTHKLR